jgi:hypothetical protein
MCKKGREKPDHLFHCDIARELWKLVFQMFGVEWVKQVAELLTCWKGRFWQNDINIV